jgi:hypothetical protein
MRPFGIPSTLHSTDAAINVQLSPTKSCIRHAAENLDQAGALLFGQKLGADNA